MKNTRIYKTGFNPDVKSHIGTPMSIVTMKPHQ